MKPIAAILDFDGVVVDSLEIHLKGWEEAVRIIFQAELSDKYELQGYSTRAIANRLATKFGDQSVAKALVKIKESYLADNIHLIPLFESTGKFLEAANACQIPTAIASNSQTIYVREILAHHNLLDKFDAIVCADQVSRPKPYPDMLWVCANRMKISFMDRIRVIAFDDSPHGIDSIRAAGMIPYGIAESQNQDLLLNQGALEVFRNLGESIALLIS